MSQNDELIDSRELFIQNAEFAKKFRHDQMVTISRCLPFMQSVRISSRQEDIDGIDFWVDIKGGIAGRVKKMKDKDKYDTFAIRTWVPYKGYDTEFRKIFELGRGKYYLYGWGDESTRKLVKWRLIDLDILRKTEAFKYAKYDTMKYSYDIFRYIPSNELFRCGSVIASSHPLEYDRSAIGYRNGIYYLKNIN